MENPTAFDLNVAIQGWRNNLSQSPEIRREDLMELESHLRDSVAVLEGKGLTGEEAFLVGVRRLGSPGSLGPEFAKINGREVWLHRALWMLIGIQGWWLLAALSRFGTDAAMLGIFAGFGTRFVSSGTSLGSISVLSLINIGMFPVCLVGCWWLLRHQRNYLRRFVEKASQQPVKTGVIAVGFFLGIYSLGSARWVLLRHYVTPEAMGVISISMTVSALVLMMLQVVGVVVMTIVLLRRVRLGLAS